MLAINLCEYILRNNPPAESALTIPVLHPTFPVPDFGGSSVDLKRCSPGCIALAVLALFLTTSQSLAQPATGLVGIFEGHGDVGTVLHRSEERRVGKECRSRW